MNQQEILQRIRAEKVIAIVRGVPTEKMPYVMEAMLNGGLSCAEITFDHSTAHGCETTLESIRQIREKFGSAITLGAGTVLTEEQVTLAVSAGADYMISPNFDSAVVHQTKKLQKVSIPGAFTPTEVVMAYNAGADVVKLFPAALLGCGYIKALRDPLAHIPVSAVGGVNPANAASFIAAGCCCLGVGGGIVNARLAADNNFAQITENARQFVAALRQGV